MRYKLLCVKQVSYTDILYCTGQGIQSVFYNYKWGFPGSLVGKESAVQETWVQSLGQEDPLEKEMEPTPVFLPGKSRRQRSLAGYSP